jgi:hypothetical protein
MAPPGRKINKAFRTWARVKAPRGRDDAVLQFPFGEPFDNRCQTRWLRSEPNGEVTPRPDMGAGLFS